MAPTAYPTSSAMRPGVEITISGSVASGGDLTVEFPDNTRAKGRVISSSASDTVIEIAGQQWSLVRTCIVPQRNQTGSSAMTWRVTLSEGVFMGRVIPT